MRPLALQQQPLVAPKAQFIPAGTAKPRPRKALLNPGIPLNTARLHSALLNRSVQRKGSMATAKLRLPQEAALVRLALNPAEIQLSAKPLPPAPRKTAPTSPAKSLLPLFGVVAVVVAGVVLS